MMTNLQTMRNKALKKFKPKTQQALAGQFKDVYSHIAMFLTPSLKLNSYPLREKYEEHFLNESMMCCIPCKPTPKVLLEFSFQSQTYKLNNYYEIEQI